MAKAMGTSLPALAASSVLQLIPCSSRLCHRAAAAASPQLSFARSLQAASPCITTLFRSHVRDANTSLSLPPRRCLCVGAGASASARASSADVSVAEAPGADASPSHASSSADAQPGAGENGTAAAGDSTALTFQDAIQRLQEYWGKQGCAVLQPSNTEVGAGTMNPATFLRVLGPEPWKAAYVEPSVRPDDSRYGENPNRVQRHTQFQVILKPDPGNAQELYLGSLGALGIDTRVHDVRFVEDNWESPVLGAWGLGWEVWLDGMEITQFTYFQQAGGMALSPVSVEITYGLERIIMSLQGVDHFKKIRYAPGITYGELFLENEKEMSAFNMDHADTSRVRQRFDLYDAEAKELLERKLAIPAFDHVLKTSHAFNVLDARGAVGVTERARFFGRMRALARQCAQLWAHTREELGHPLGTWEQGCEPPLGAAESAGAEPRDFVLEIGAEELPPDDVTSATQQLLQGMEALLKRLRLDHGGVRAFGTPRRLSVVVRQLATAQRDSSEELRGPPAAKAFDASGAPTKALEGFCRRNGVEPGDVVTRPDEKGVEYVYAQVVQKGRPTGEVLAEEMPALIAQLSFPKTMRWNSQVQFSRPLRWLLALHGEALVPFSYALLASGRTSQVLRNASSPSVSIARAEDYESEMEKAGIALSAELRGEAIWKKAQELAQGVGGRVPESARGALLEEVANLVEAPAPLLGSFSEKFLELPREVLVTVMRKHQRYFPVEDGEGRGLLPHFVAVPNGAVSAPAVRAGNEAVLRARYEDACFFYDADTARPLASFRDKLAGITFQEALGSMLQKSERVEALVGPLIQELGLGDADAEVTRRAAPLANADLGTAMVMEFTDLAGVMGRHYALREGTAAEVAEAVLESVLPRSAGDTLPQTAPGQLLSIASRLDSLVGLFGIGCEPTASADPFGLRRAAYALVDVTVAAGLPLKLPEAFRIAAAVQPVPVSQEALDQAQVFVVRRLEQLLVDRGAGVEVVRAVLAERGGEPARAAQTVAEMEAVQREGVLDTLVAVYSRPTRITRGKDIDAQWQVQEALFEGPEEAALWAAYQQVAAAVPRDADGRTFAEASLLLQKPLDDFFTNVFVMAEDEKVRNNRLALVNLVATIPSGIIDLSLLPGF